MAGVDRTRALYILEMPINGTDNEGIRYLLRKILRERSRQGKSGCFDEVYMHGCVFKPRGLDLMSKAEQQIIIAENEIKAEVLLEFCFKKDGTRKASGTDVKYGASILERPASLDDIFSIMESKGVFFDVIVIFFLFEAANNPGVMGWLNATPLDVVGKDEKAKTELELFALRARCTVYQICRNTRTRHIEYEGPPREASDIRPGGPPAQQAEILRQLREAQQESARAREESMHAHERAREAQEAAERERQERVAERQQAADRYRALLRRQEARRQYREYTYPELEAATDGFSPAKVLGAGGFGKVYLGRVEHMPAAIKVLNLDGSQGLGEFRRELEILSRLRHPHIVMLMGCCPERSCLVYEYCANGSLEDRLQCKGGSAPLPWFTRIRIAFEVAVALLYMHTSTPITVHKDVKPSNILLDQNLTCKLGDVGIASVAPRLAAQTSLLDTSLRGSPHYIDPEYQRTGTFNQKSDVYAFGICLLQLLTNRPAFGLLSDVEDAIADGTVMQIVDRTAGSWEEHVAIAVANLGLKCAETRRRDRLDLGTQVLPVLEAVRIVAMDAAAREASQGLNQGEAAPGEEDGVVPSIFLCPISHDIMEDPVFADDGNTYERSEIHRWFQLGNRTSPLTNAPVARLDLTPNLLIRSAIKEWQEGNRQNFSRYVTGLSGSP